MRTLIRPQADASRDERVRFVGQLREALDALGVEPGDVFILAPADGNQTMYALTEHDENSLGPIGATATSRKAALQNYPKSGSQRHRILESLMVSPKTREEIANFLHIPDNSVRPRVKELMEGGWVTATDEVRRTATGADAEVLTVTDKFDAANGEVHRQLAERGTHAGH